MFNFQTLSGKRNNRFGNIKTLLAVVLIAIIPVVIVSCGQPNPDPNNDTVVITETEPVTTDIEQPEETPAEQDIPADGPDTETVQIEIGPEQLPEEPDPVVSQDKAQVTNNKRLSKAIKYYNLGLDNLNRGKYKKALKNFKKVIKFNPGDPWAHNYLGICCGKIGKFSDELTAYATAIYLNPQFAEAYHNRGLAFQRSGMPREAIYNLKKTIELDPAYASDWITIGDLYASLDLYDQAVESYDSAIEHNANPKGAYAGKTLARHKLLEYEPALEAVNKAIKLDPMNARLYFYKANILDDQENTIDALIEINTAVEIKPSYAQAHYNRGIFLAKLTRYEEAISSIDKALKYNPRDANAYNIKGTIQFELGQYKQSLASYKKALKLDPDSYEAHYNVSLAYEKLENHSLANKYRKKANRLKSKSE
jgi:tetratricopeptide (TPR) repeat protein